MSRAEPRKLFGRPTASLLDEEAPPGVPPLIRVDPPRAFSVSAASPLAGQVNRSVTSLPDELDDPDDFADEDTAQDVRSNDEDWDESWGAAFEVDDFRAARREDPDADLVTGPATVRMLRPGAPPADDEDELVAMPEEGDEVEHTGVGEQVALPDGFGEDISLGGLDLPPEPSAEPGPFERMHRGPPPRLAVDEVPEGLSLTWMGQDAGPPEDLAEIVEDANLLAERSRERRQSALNAAIFAEPTADAGQPPAFAPPPARPAATVAAFAPAAPPAFGRGRDSGPAQPEPPVEAPAADAFGATRPPGPSRSRFAPPWATSAPDDGIPDAIAALAEALERDPAPAPAEPRRLRPASGEPPRISRREREADPVAPPVPLRRRPPEQQDARGRRLARPTLPGGADPYETPRRPRPAPPREGVDGPAPRRSLAPVVMPAPSFAPGDTPQPAPVADPYAAVLERASKPAAARPRPTRVRAPQPRQAPRSDVSPAIAGIALLLFITGLAMLVIPRFNRRSPPVPQPASGPVMSVAPAPVEPTPPAAVPAAPVAPPAPVAAAPAPTPVVEPAPVEKPVASPTPTKSSAYRVALGVIRVNSDRKALIILDGKQQGYAPGLPDISVMPGAHTVRAVVSGTGLSRTMEIRVDAGSAVVAEFSFQ